MLWTDRWRGGCSAWLEQRRWSYGSFSRQDEISWILVLIDLARRSCSESTRQRTPLGDPCLEIVGLGGSQSCAPMFLSNNCFRGSASKLCWLLISWSMLTHFIILAENVIEGKICGGAMVAWVFVVLRNWLGDLWLGAAVCKWGRLHIRSPKSCLAG
jgi:hypothetical protein